MTDDLVSLRAFLALNNVEFYFVAFFQAFVAIDLNGAVVYKNVGSIVASDKAVPFCIVKPFDLAFVLRHEPCPSLKADYGWGVVQPAFLRDAVRGGLVFL